MPLPGTAGSNPQGGSGRNCPRSPGCQAGGAEGRAQRGTHQPRAGDPAIDRRWKVEQGNRRSAQPQREYGCRSPGQHHGRAWHSQDRGTGGIRDSQRAGEHPVNRRSFMAGLAALASAASLQRDDAWGLLGPPAPGLGFKFPDVTGAAGLQFHHNSGAYGGKLLPETLGSGCAFLDYDADGWQDILLVNGMDWAGHKRERSTLRLYRNNRNGTFTDVTRNAGLDLEMYGMGVAVGDYNNDGFPDILVTCVGQNRLFRNTGKGTFLDVTRASGLSARQAFSTSALWFDYDRDGLLDLFVCNYVRWSPEHDVFCSLDGKHKSFCTPEAYRGDTCWLFHNRGDGTFEDVAVEAGLAFSTEGKARAGMGVDVADFENSGSPGIAITNFDNEMIGLYRLNGKSFEDIALTSGVGAASKSSLGFGCAFLDANLDGWLDFAVANGHIDETVRNIRGNVGYAQPPQLLLNSGKGSFRDVAAELGGGFDQPKVGRGLA